MIQRFRTSDGVFVGTAGFYEVPKPRRSAPDVMDAVAHHPPEVGITIHEDGRGTLHGGTMSAGDFDDWVAMVTDTLATIEKDDAR